MRTPSSVLVAVALLAAVHTTISAVDEVACTFPWFPTPKNVKYTVGTTVALEPAAGNELICQALCAANADCFSYYWDKTASKCYTVKDSSPGTTDPNSVSGAKQVTCYNTLHTKLCSLNQDYKGPVTLQGGSPAVSFDVAAVRTLGACATICVTNPLCRAFHHDATTAKCTVSQKSLITPSTGSKLLSYVAGHVSSPTVSCAPTAGLVPTGSLPALGNCKLAWNTQAGVQYSKPTLDTKTMAATEATCQSTCAADMLCTGYNYDPITKECWTIRDPRRTAVTSSVLNYGRRQYICPHTVGTQQQECTYNFWGGFGPYRLESDIYTVNTRTNLEGAMLLSLDSTTFGFSWNTATAQTSGILPNSGQPNSYSAGITNPFDPALISILPPNRLAFQLANAGTAGATACKVKQPECKVGFRTIIDKKLIRVGAPMAAGSASAKACKDTCAADPTCYGVMYTPGVCSPAADLDQVLPTLQADTSTTHTVFIPQRKCGECMYQRVPQRTGRTTKTDQSSTYNSEDSCLNRCYLNRKASPPGSTVCVAIEWDTVGKTCNFFFVKETYALLDSTPATVANKVYYFLSICDVCSSVYVPYTPGYTVTPAQCPGTDLVSITFSIQTETDCQAACDSDTMCYAAIYDSGSAADKCKICKKNFGSPTRDVSKPTSSVYIRSFKCFSACKYQSYPQAAGLTTGRIAVAKGDADACRLACDDDALCTALTFDTANTKCYTYTTDIGTPSVDVNYVTYKKSPAGCSSCTLKFDASVNYGQVGAAVLKSPMATYTADECTLKCRQNEACVAADFTANVDICTMYTVLTSLSPNLRNTNFRKTWKCGECSFATYPGKYGTGASTTQSTQTSGSTRQCLDSCAKTSGCKAAAFSSKASVCNFYTIDNTQQLTNNNDYVYYSAGVCKACMPEYTPALTNKMMSLNQVPAFPAVNEAACQSLCNANDKCLALAYISLNNQCYLFVTRTPIIASTSGQIFREKQIKCEGGCRFKVYSSSKPSTGTIRPQTTMKTMIACLAGCEKDANCKSATFSATNVCNFYDEDFAASLSADTSLIYYVADACKVCKDVYEVKASSQNTGISLGLQTASDAAKCQAFCSADEQCVAAAFQTSASTCNKFGTHPTSLTVNTDYTYYKKTKVCKGQCPFTVYSNRDAPKTSVGLRQTGVVDVNDCLAKCSADARCKSIAYNNKFSTCSFFVTNVDISLLPVSLESVFMTSGACKDCSLNKIVTPSRTMGGGSALGAMAQSVCFARCEANPICIAATCSDNGAACWHHTTRSPIQEIIGWTVMQKTSKCGSCVMYPYPAQKVGGVVTQTPQTSIRTRDECLAGCAAHPECKSMVFQTNAISPATACFFLPGEHKTQLVSDPNYYFYDGAACKVCRRKYRVLANKALTSGSPQTKAAADEAACKKDCEGGATCFGYEWNSLQKRCRTFTDLGARTTSSVVGVNVYDLYRDCEGCAMKPFPKKIATGGVAKAHAIEVDCIHACQTDATCFGATFNMKTSSCHHFQTDVSNSLTSDANTDYWSAIECRICKLEYKLTPNFKQAKPGTAVPGVTSLAACQKACNAQPTCVGVDFFRSNGACYWFTDTAAALQQDSNVDQYKRTRNCGGCVFSPYSKMTGKSGTAQPTINSEVQCLDGCRTTTTCKACSYDSQTNMCQYYTIDDTTQLVVNTPSTYWSAGACKDCLVSYKLTLNGARSGGNLHNVVSLNQCKSLCTSDPKCAAFDYNKINNQVCYLHYDRKSVVTQGNTFDSHTKELDCDGCSFQLYPSQSRGSGVQKKAFMSSVSCAAGCQKDSTCQAISFTLPTNLCQFYTTPDTTALVPDPNTVYWTSGQCKVCSSMYKETKGVYMIAYTTSTTTHTTAECRKMCEVDPKCVGYDVYLLSSPKIGCYLSQGTIKTNTANDPTAWANFAKVVDCGECKFTPTPGKGGSGGRAQPAIDTEKKCISNCATDAKCQATDYNPTTKVCNMYDALSTTLTTKLNTNYWQTTGCKACAYDFTEHKNRVMVQSTSSYQTMGAIDAAICKTKCLETVQCVAFTHSTAMRQCSFYSNALASDTANGNVNDVISLYRRAVKCEGNCMYTRYADFFAPGGVEQVGYVSVMSCLAACTKAQTCISVTFKAAKCYFHQMDATPTIFSERGSQFYSGVNCKKCVVEYAVSSSSRVASAASVPYTTEASCRAYCTSDRNCVSVDFDVVSNQCFMNTNQAATRSPSTTRTNRWKSHKCGACRYYPWTNRKVPTGIVQPFTNLVDCLRGCTDNIGCVASYYDYRNSKCYFSTNVFDVTKLTVQSDHVFFEARQCKECRYTMNKLTGVLWGGGTELASSVNTEGLCQQACLADFGCVATDFDLLNRKCSQHNSQGSDIAGQANYNHFRKVVDCGGCQYSRLSGTRTSQTGIAKPAAKDTLACGKACKDDSSCQGGFEFDTVTKICRVFGVINSALFTSSAPTDVWKYEKCKGCRERYIPSANRKTTGVTLSRTGSNTLDGCTADCQRTGDCVGYDFSLAVGCYLITSYGGRLVVDTGFQHFDRVQDCEGCHFNRYMSKRGVGGVRQSHTALKTCLEACYRDTACGSIDYNTVTNECYFLVDDPRDASLNAAPGFSHYSPSNCKQCPIGFQIKEQNKIAANQMLQQGVLTVLGCQRACQTDTSCVGIGFNRGLNQCVKHLTTLSGVTADATRNWDLYRKYRECAGCLYAPYPKQKAAIGGAVANAATDVTTCLYNCQTDARCVDIDFNQNLKTCLHFSTARTSALISDSSTTHWSKVGCTNQGCSISWEILTTSEAIISGTGSQGNTEAECQKNCATQRACVGFNFRNSRCYFVTDPNAAIRVQTTSTMYKQQDRCTGTARGDCTFSYLGERQGTGTSTTVTASTLASCLKECVGVGGCVGVTYNLNTRACQLFAAASSVANTAPAIGRVSYMLKGCTQDVTTKPPIGGTTPARGCIPLWMAYTDSHASGGVERASGATVQDCRTKCLGTTGCSAVDTKAQAGVVQCWLHLNNPNVLNQRSTMTGVVFHFLQDRCPSSGTTTPVPTTAAPTTPLKTTQKVTAQTVTTATGCVSSWAPTLGRNTAGATAEFGITGGLDRAGIAYKTGLAKCQKKCETNPKCVSAEVDRDTSHVFCWIQESITSYNQALSSNSFINPTVDIYRIARCTGGATTVTVPPSTCTEKWQVYVNKQTQQGTNDPTASISLQECKNRCITRSSGSNLCVAIDYTPVPGTYHCWYHTSLANVVNNRQTSQLSNQHVLLNRCINGVSINVGGATNPPVNPNTNVVSFAAGQTANRPTVAATTPAPIGNTNNPFGGTPPP